MVLTHTHGDMLPWRQGLLRTEAKITYLRQAIAMKPKRRSGIGTSCAYLMRIP
jgi:hypothetical protein